MKIFLTDQTPKFSKYLSDLKRTPVMSYERSKMIEKVSQVPVQVDFQHADLSSFFNYEIFPHNILTFRTQWQEEGRQMRIGDTILQQVYIPPFKYFSQKIIFGVRICEIIETEEQRGFSYETLQGHVEKGISTFTIERSGHACVFKIQTFSKPGNFLTQLLGPLISVPYQTFCTKMSLQNIKRKLESKTSI